MQLLPSIYTGTWLLAVLGATALATQNRKQLSLSRAVEPRVVFGE